MDDYIELQCADGYTGPLCGICSRNETHLFAPEEPFLCAECKDSKTYKIVALTVTTLFTLFAALFNNATVYHHRQDQENISILLVVLILYF